MGKDTRDDIGRGQSAPKDRKGKSKSAASPCGGPPAAGTRAPQECAALFERKDTHHDGKLSREEFLSNRPDRETASVHFALWDADKHRFLSREELIYMGKQRK